MLGVSRGCQSVRTVRAHVRVACLVFVVCLCVAPSCHIGHMVLGSGYYLCAEVSHGCSSFCLRQREDHLFTCRLFFDWKTMSGHGAANRQKCEYMQFNRFPSPRDHLPSIHSPKQEPSISPPWPVFSVASDFPFVNFADFIFKKR